MLMLTVFIGCNSSDVKVDLDKAEAEAEAFINTQFDFFTEFVQSVRVFCI